MDTAYWRSAAIRAVRTFIQTFAGVIVAFWISGGTADGTRITGLWDAIQVQWDLAAGAGLLAALAALGWRAFLDPSSVPSLSDGPPHPEPSAASNPNIIRGS